jgi:HAD superfamily hydrolase (TIGR01490 family)
MTVHKDVIENIENSPEGPQVGAFFDFDGTLIAGFSATVFLREQVRRGDISPYEFVEIVSALTQFSLGGVGFSGLMSTAARFMRGTREADYIAFGQELYEQQIARKVYPESRALVRAHMDRGHTVAIISSATPYQVEPVARDLGIEHVICSRYEVRDGVFTGGIERPLCFGPGKVSRPELLLQRQRRRHRVAGTRRLPAAAQPQHQADRDFGTTRLADPALQESRAARRVRFPEISCGHGLAGALRHGRTADLGPHRVAARGAQLRDLAVR